MGILRGLETFLQLITITPSGFSVPAVTIHDQPRFVWRGTLIDVGRHFIPIDVLKRNIDGMAAVKLNVLHWHLYDSEGFRIESKRFPKLQEDGSDGRYYTQEEIRDFIAYAHDRGVRIMPEFEMPGHSRSMYVGYPELASGPGPYKMEPGAPDAEMDPTREETYKFIDKFMEEMAATLPRRIFPYRRRRSCRQGMGSQPENSGFHARARHEEQARPAGLLQPAPAKDRRQAPQDHGGMG